MLRWPLLLWVIMLAMVAAPAARAAGQPVLDVAVAAAAQHCPGSEAPSDSASPGMGMSCATACAAVHAILPSLARYVEKQAMVMAPVGRPPMVGVGTRFELPPPRA